ncbi:MAG: proprotein convertase P-domain-containing protein [Flavobacteriales bacterium]|nr:proprotein convertase P-domain-containing protein [Flavobacteriales bacterium]
MAQPGSTCGTFTSSPGLAIVDNATVQDVITTGPQGGQVISDLNVYLDITHTWNSDVTVELLSPEGTNITLLSGECGSTDNMDVELDDEAVDPIGTTCPPIGVFEIPSTALSSFDGEVFEGDWTLSISDGATGDPGTLNTWCLIPTLAAPPSCTDPIATPTLVETDCATGTFTVEVDLTSLGSATNVDITEDVNGGGATVVEDDVTALQVYVLGPYAIGDVVDVAVLHNDDSACDLALGTFQSALVCGTLGVCDQNLAIPDNQCPTTFDISFGATAPGTQLGTDVVVGSVDLIISHTWQSDLEVSLTSPNGVTVPLFTNIGNGSDNFGDPGNCPAGVLTFIDGGGAFPGGLNPTGPMAAEGLMTDFNDGSDPNGTWVLSVCDGASGDFGEVEYLQINFLTCVSPAATPTLVETDCATGTFTVEVDLTDLGSATDVDITEDVNGGGATVVHDDVSTLQVYVMGPYNIGDVVDVVVVHNTDGTCNVDLGSFSSGLGCPVLGTCDLNIAIPDNQCPTTLDLDFAATAPGTQLGTDVFLGSVDLIISHTWQSDVEVSLTSPNGVTVPLFTGIGSSADNFGNPSNCPTDVLTFVDGGGAFPGGTNPTGQMGAEGLLSDFNDGSDPNGVWVLSLCDGAGGDTGELEYLQLNFLNCLPPTATTAIVTDCGNDQFFIDVDVSGLGSATTVDITSDLNGTEATGVGTGITQVGPYPSGSTVNLTVVHDADNSCDLALASVNFTCPPPNDDVRQRHPGGLQQCDCRFPRPEPPTPKRTTVAPLPSTAPGVWYTPDGYSGLMTASLCGSSYDTKIGVFDGTAGCGALVCVGGNDDDLFTGGAGVCGGGIQSSHQWNSTAGTPYYIYVTGFDLEAGNFVLQVACGDQNPPCTENTVELELNTDASGSETSWEIIPVGIPTPVCSGSGYLDNDQVFETCCLPDGCYRLRVLDSFGDGMSTGDYVLRDGNGNRIIDNTGGGAGFTSVSAIANSGAFCLPLGTDQVIYSQCDKMDFLLTDFLIASENAAVTAEFGVNDGNSGYQFWLFDPNGSYSRRVFFSHANPMVGAPPGALAAAHLRFGNLITNPVPVDQMLNVRIRGRVNGTFNEFGPTCQIMVVSTLPACPTTQLIDDPNNANFSCGVTRTFGGSDKVVAYPVAGANLYRFRFEQIGDAFARNITSPTSSRLLNWVTSPLVPGASYNVFVQASFDGGANWCPYGDPCQVDIVSPPAASRLGADDLSNVNLWPNPNRGDQFQLTINELPEEALTVNVDIHDLFGKRVAARTYPAQGGMLNTVVDLDGQLAAGMYVVSITAGDKLFTERLVIE